MVTQDSKSDLPLVSRHLYSESHWLGDFLPNCRLKSTHSIYYVRAKLPDSNHLILE